MYPTHRIDFDLNRIDLPDIKAIYRLFYFGQDTYLTNPDTFQAVDLMYFQSFFEPEENTEVKKIVYLAALIKEGAIRLVETDYFSAFSKNSEKLLSILYHSHMEFNLDESDYDGLNSEGPGVISLMMTYQFYPLEEIILQLTQYNFLVPLPNEG
jgi:hypothetical protein